MYDTIRAGYPARDAKVMGGVRFAAALALCWLSSARGLIWANSSKLTPYATQEYFPSLNPGDHPGWTVAAWA